MLIRMAYINIFMIYTHLLRAQEQIHVVFILNSDLQKVVTCYHHPCLSDNDTLSLSSPLLSSPSLSSLYPVPSDNNGTLILTSSNDDNGDGTLALTSSDN